MPSAVCLPADFDAIDMASQAVPAGRRCAHRQNAERLLHESDESACLQMPPRIGARGRRRCPCARRRVRLVRLVLVCAPDLQRAHRHPHAARSARGPRRVTEPLSGGKSFDRTLRKCGNANCCGKACRSLTDTLAGRGGRRRSGRERRPRSALRVGRCREAPRRSRVDRGRPLTWASRGRS